MAKTESKSRQKSAVNVTATAVVDPPAVAEPHLEAPAPTPPPKKHKAGPGRPARGTPSPQNRSVFARMSEIPEQDWGSRAWIYLYRMEPFTDRLRSGNVVHIKKYHEPIDEDRVMHEEGSGKYRAILSFRKPGTDRDSEMERVEFEVLNMAHPPNVPIGEWVDDPRNRKWAWAKKMIEDREAAKNAPPPLPPAGSDVVETLRVFNEIQDSAAKRAQDSAPTQPSMLETIRTVKELFPQTPPQAENALLATIVTLMTEQTKAAQTEARELRQEIREMRTNTGQQQGNAGFKSVLSEIKDMLPMVREIFPQAADRADGILSGAGGRSRMSGAQEVMVEVARAVAPALQPAIPFILSRFFAPPNLNPTRPGVSGGPITGPPAPMLPGGPQTVPLANPGAPGAPGGPETGPPAQQQHPLIPFLQAVTPGMLRYFGKYAAGSEEHSGADFYDALIELYGPTYEGQDWHAGAKQAGVMGMIGLYQASAYWPQLQPHDAKFANFITDFLTAAEPEPGEAAEVIDFTQEENPASV